MTFAQISQVKTHSRPQRHFIALFPLGGTIGRSAISLPVRNNCHLKLFLENFLSIRIATM